MSSHKAILTTAALAALALAGCGKEKPQAAPAAVPVTVATAEQKTVPIEVRAIGTVEPFTTVGVKAQVNGELVGVHFSEGQDVRKGQLLFSLDRRPLEAELRRAEGTLAKSSAQLAQAEADFARYTALLKEGVVARERYEQVRTEMEALRAAVQADKAAVENARVQLSYCSIYAPIDGRTGSLQVHKGNLVKANADTPMVVINQLRPIYASFALPEQFLGEVKSRMRGGKLRVEATIPKTEQPPATGWVSFVDNEVNRETGTILLKGEFENRDGRLWPGQFVDMELTLAERPNAVLVPTPAVQTGQDGQFVFVVKQDLTAEQRPVKTAGIVGDSTIIEEGIQPGERVVTDGQLRLVPGAKVEVKSGPQTASTAGSGK